MSQRAAASVAEVSSPVRPRPMTQSCGRSLRWKRPRPACALASCDQQPARPVRPRSALRSGSFVSISYVVAIICHLFCFQRPSNGASTSGPRVEPHGTRGGRQAIVGLATARPPLAGLLPKAEDHTLVLLASRPTAGNQGETWGAALGESAPWTPGPPHAPALPAGMVPVNPSKATASLCVWFGRF